MEIQELVYSQTSLLRSGPHFAHCACGLKITKNLCSCEAVRSLLVTRSFRLRYISGGVQSGREGPVKLGGLVWPYTST